MISPCGFRTWRTLVASLGCCLLSPVSLPAVFAADAAKKSFDIPPGTAAAALKQFSTQSGQQVLYSNDEVAGVNTNAVKGELSVRDALDRMLAGTPLVATHDERNAAVAVGRVESLEKKPRAAAQVTCRRRDARPRPWRGKRSSSAPSS